ncbi:glycolate oxidase FAD binding subunit [Nitrosospira multiformis ATCC 25196]|uniref:FAD linked oxidase-like protein n=1 Tax=Nitrosospira multiformis (strain ATCC 25196 / NCIMB 11849 / C 71) TaxID=323848 RepID=Q2YCN9_NITMU|nr:glycolate oxidase subunit GlcE [Nitrosospira multiformis]ABB73482.1 FAD linked oxidase-like protein [Nitrosospira multiformis ATCC 25196]SEG19081.1 glycolate oxidase FAD binding subunit [Nitrosospira multiformis ATCC 25196]
MQEIVDQLAATIRAAAASNVPLRIRSGGTKDFYGQQDKGRDVAPEGILDPTAFAGIVDYEPTELVVTARTGTPLAQLETELNGRGQMLAFEPPHFGAGATLGGCIAAGLSGPRRASAGAVRDFVLGVRMLDGRGDDLSFGGRVMKNVAGYDIPRLMAGSLGTLGLLLEVSLKVLPLPAEERTLRLSMNEAVAIETMNRWAGKPLPVSATCFCEGELTVRLSGATSAVRAARAVLGGEEIVENSSFWKSIREQVHPFFRSGKQLWRLSIKSTTAPLSLPGKQLIEWGGAVRWLSVDAEMDNDAVETLVRKTAKEAGGHATLFRSRTPAAAVFHPLPPAMMNIHRQLKEKFDPMRIFNRGRLYPEL